MRVKWSGPWVDRVREGTLAGHPLRVVVGTTGVHGTGARAQIAGHTLTCSGTGGWRKVARDVVEIAKHWVEERERELALEGLDATAQNAHASERVRSVARRLARDLRAWRVSPTQACAILRSTVCAEAGVTS